MSSALPMALLRPSCPALRPSAAVNWNTVTLAFARRFCSQHACSTPSSRSSLLSVLKSQSSPLTEYQCRSFSVAPQSHAKVEASKAKVAANPYKQRTVSIGPLPGGDVDRKTIARIFGPKISTSDGNHVLRILHHRRTSGSLADYGVDNLGHRYAAVGRPATIKALDWLREKHPIDEARAAEEWAEKEANRISYELWLADPDNAGSKYNDPAREFQEQQEQQQQKQVEEHQAEPKKIGMLTVGPSQFELNILQKRKERMDKAAAAAEEKERRARDDEVKLASGEWVKTPSGKQLMKPGQEAVVDIWGREVVSRRKEYLEIYQKKAQTKFTSEEEMLNATTLKQRLLPMTAFVIVTCLLSYGIAHYYVPPSPEYRIWPDVSPTFATIATIVAANAFLCLAWRVGPLWPLMTKYFMHVPGYPRAVQSVLNIFSHVQYEHLFSNMMFFLLVGTVCHDLVDRGIFMGTYVSAGAVGTLASLYWANLGRGAITAHSVGASAAIWGIAALYCLLTEQETIKIPFVKDMEVSFHPKMLFGAFVAMELLQARKGKKSTMDHASHFGGMAVGMSVAGYLRATGFHERKRMSAGTDGVQDRAGVERKTVDVGAIVKEEVAEVKKSVEKIIK